MARTESGLIKIQKTPLRPEIHITGLYTFFYMEHPKDYVFKGERHDFWEFLYVDKGEIEVMAEDRGYKLLQGDIIFHKPREFHSVWANRRSAPNIVVITFDCRSAAMAHLEGKIFSLHDKQRDMLAQILKIGREVFLDFDEEKYALIKKDTIPFGSEQLFLCHLEAFLIELIRSGNHQNSESKLHAVMKERVEKDIIKGVLAYLESNISANPTFKELCRINSVSETQLKTLFKEVTGMSVMKYFKAMKIEKAKRIIREENHTITHISEMLGYSSVFYFSKSFKDITGMTPTEYAVSVNALPS